MTNNEEEFLRSLFKDDTLQFFKSSVIETKILIVERIQELSGINNGEIRRRIQ